MSQLTFQLDENAEQAVAELKEFFGTKSSASAIRSALSLARNLVPTSDGRTILVKDQNTHQDIKIVFAR